MEDTLSGSQGNLVAFYDATLERLTKPYQTQRVDMRYGNTHVISAGAESAAPILVLHGSASNAAGCWPLITYRREKCFGLEMGLMPSLSTPFFSV